MEKEKQRHEKNGAKSAYVLHYPYEKGHFRLYYGDGRSEYAWLGDEIYREASRAWRKLEVPGDGHGESDDELLLLTYIRLMRKNSRASNAPSLKERALIRLLMDAHIPGMKGRIIRLVGECYSDNLRQKRGMGHVEACARKCFHSLKLLVFS